MAERKAKIRMILSWVCRVIAALVMLQTLFFKFTGADESIYIFSRVFAEPWGRYFIGTWEFTSSILLLVPRTTWLGAIMTRILMLGAISVHLTVIGIEVQGDGGFLFCLAVITLTCSIVVSYLEREKRKLKYVIPPTDYPMEDIDE